MNRSLNWHIALSGLLLLLTSQAFAKILPWQKFVTAEKSLQVQENRLTELASGLEEWLSGRRSKAQLDKIFQSVKSQARSQNLSGLPAQLSNSLGKRERELLGDMERFAALDSPDAEGQRSLFSTLSEKNEQRTLELLDWRQKTIVELSKKVPRGNGRAYLDWESAWYPIWIEEAKLTRRLQQGTLRETLDEASKKQILKGLLRLRLRAENIVTPQDFGALQTISQERLTVLARTAEQLLRIETRKSRGAITKVRRLSRKLNKLTQEFQAQRLMVLKSLN